MARKQPVKPLAEAPPEPESSSTSSADDGGDAEDDSSTDADVPTPITTQHPAVSSSDEEEEEDDEDEQQQQTPATPSSKKPTTTATATAAVTTTAANQSSSSEEEDPEEDSDDEPPLQLAKLKSASKPNAKPTSPPPKPRSKPTIAALPADNTKRSSETTPNEKPTKKSKKDPATPATATTTNEDGPKKLIQRIFSEEDDIVILKGLVDFKERKGGDPLKNDDEFYGFMKKRVSVEVRKEQMIDKVRRLKRKFMKNVKNTKKKSMNEHEKTGFELSKKIWEVKDDDKIANGSVVKEKSDDKKDYGVVTVAKMGNVDDESDDDLMEEDVRVGEREVKEGLRSEAMKRMGENVRGEIREMWRKVEIAQLEVDLMREQARVQETKRIMEALGLAKR